MTQQTESKTTHTPGPWFVGAVRMVQHQLCVAINADQGFGYPTGPVPLASTHMHEARRDRRYAEAEAQANARLIAASPDLLAACESLVAWASNMGGWESPAWDQARAAIAKARGEGV